VQVLQPLIACQTFETYVDLKESLKCECAKLRIPYDSGLITEAIDSLELSRRQPIVASRLRKKPVEPEPAKEIINRQDATHLYAMILSEMQKRGVL
jgi:hypothetical protein